MVSGYSSPTTTGVSQSFTVTARDAYNNVATGYTGTVHFSSSDAQAFLPADYTFVSGDSGTHTFFTTLKTVGTQSITATDTVTSSITGTQSGITVNVVLKANTTTVVASSANPSVYGQPVSFTATVTSSSGTPTGTVQFQIDGSDFGQPMPLAGGSATSNSVSNLGAGNHAISATYSGDSNFNCSTSAQLTQTVLYNWGGFQSPIHGSQYNIG